MDFYFEALDTDGQWEAGLVVADDDERAKEVIHLNNLELMDLRPATPDEVESQSYDLLFEPLPDPSLGDVTSMEDVLLPLTEGECEMHIGERHTVGQLSFLITKEGQKLLFSNQAADIFDLEDRYWELPVEEVDQIEKRGLLAKRLELTTKSGEQIVFKGNITKADLLIRFSMFEKKES